jgi:hypothetical protein
MKQFFLITIALFCVSFVVLLVVPTNPDFGAVVVPAAIVMGLVFLVWGSVYGWMYFVVVRDAWNRDKNIGTFGCGHVIALFLVFCLFVWAIASLSRH